MPPIVRQLDYDGEIKKRERNGNRDGWKEFSQEGDTHLLGDASTIEGQSLSEALWISKSDSAQSRPPVR